MAVPPRTDFFTPKRTFTVSNGTVGFTLGSSHSNVVKYTGSSTCNKVLIKVSRTNSYSSAVTVDTISTTSTTPLWFSFSITRPAQSGTISTTDYNYLFFIFYNSSTYLGHVAMDISSSTGMSSGTYYIHVGGVGYNPTAGSTTSKIGELYNVMLVKSSSNNTWADMKSPIAYTGDYSAGSADTKKSVIIYNSSAGQGRAIMSNGTLKCPLWTAPTNTTVTNGYANNQAVRWCDINGDSVTT